MEVRVTAAASTRTQELTGAEYEKLYSNGRRCGAACEPATVTVQLPA